MSTLKSSHLILMGLIGLLMLGGYGMVIIESLMIPQTEMRVVPAELPPTPHEEDIP